MLFKNKTPTFLAILLLGVLQFQLHLPLLAQELYHPEKVNPMVEPWRWKTFPMLRGKGVRCLTEDHEGNMWFGVDKGIMIYNGYQWNEYNEIPFKQTPVNVLYTATDGRVFAGGESGLFLHDQGNWVKLFPVNDDQFLPVTLIKELFDQSLIIGISNGMLHLKEGVFTVYTSRTRLPEFQTLLPDIQHVFLPDDVLFDRNVGAVDDIHEISPNELQVFLSVSNRGKILSYNINNVSNHHLGRYSVSTSLSNTELADRQTFLFSSVGEQWLVNAYYKSGIFRHTGKNWQYFKLSDTFGGDEIYTSIVESLDGTIWLGGQGKLYSYNDGQWQIYTSPAYPVPTSRITVYETDDGNLWLMGIMGDVFRIDFTNNKWLTYRNLNFEFADKNNWEWYISNNNKVVVHTHEEWFSYGSGEGMIDAPVKLYYTSEGMIWVAGSHGGVAATAYLKDNRWIKELHPKLSWGIDYRSVFESTDGSLWFGACVDRQVDMGQLAGVLRLSNPGKEPHQWQHYASESGIGQQNVYGIGESADGALWIGGSRLHQFDGLRWSSVPQLDKLGEYVDIVYSSPQQKLWVGSRFYGLFRYDGHDWTHFSTDQGLSSNTIISVFQESDSSVWVVTDKNICWYDGENWFSDIFSSNFPITREGGNVITHNKDVYINHSIREWKRRAFPFSKTPDNAYTDFWVMRYSRDANPPQTYFDYYPEKVSYRGSALVSWSGKDFWEETPSEKLVYSYRINDGKWSDFEPKTNITLTELKDGHYTFEVRSRDLDYNIDISPASVTFRVTPPVWKQAWFIALITIFIIVVAFYEIRILRRNAELLDLNTSLNAVNEKLERRQQLIEKQKDEILIQSTQLENKNEILELQNTKIARQRDKLESMVKHVEDLSKVRLRFFTNISHEFRTPLTLILCSIEQLMSNRGTLPTDQINKAYDVIQKNTRRVYKLINQILEVRRIETGTLKYNPENGDICSFVNQLVLLFGGLATQQNIKLSFTPQQKSIITVFDHDKIEKILFNLISNSFKNTPSQGAIHVGVSLITESNNKQSTIPVPYIELYVEDTGKGIPSESTHQIFERFYQIDEDDKNMNFDSSGIGLSFVKDLVKIHYGKIHVESELGKGSRFSVHIPYASPETVNAEAVEAFDYEPTTYLSDNIQYDIEAVGNSLMSKVGNVQTEKEKVIEVKEMEEARKKDKLIVMVVEDEEDLRRFIRNSLSDKYVVIEASNGKQGLEKALEIQPDLIVSDIMMPEMDGLEMTRKIKDDLITCHIPVILLTARVAHDQKVAGYETGADAYIEKPFSNRMLKTRISNLIKTREKLKEKLKRDLIIDPDKITISSADDQMLSEMFNVLEENISDSAFDVESMSQAFLLSRSHFTRKVKQITNLSPKQLLDTFRLKRACHLLTQNKLTVSEIAYMVGFDHPNSFSRTFRKYYDMSPTEFLSQN